MFSLKRPCVASFTVKGSDLTVFCLLRACSRLVILLSGVTWALNIVKPGQPVPRYLIVSWWVTSGLNTFTPLLLLGLKHKFVVFMNLNGLLMTQTLGKPLVTSFISNLFIIMQYFQQSILNLIQPSNKFTKQKWMEVYTCRRNVKKTEGQHKTWRMSSFILL